MDIGEVRAQIEALAAGNGDVRDAEGRVVDDAIAALDEGRIRVAEPGADGTWKTNAWVKQAILLYFQRRDVEWIGDPARDALVYYDKLPVKRNYEELGVRAVPPGVARYGSFSGARRDPDARLREHRRLRR